MSSKWNKSAVSEHTGEFGNILLSAWNISENVVHHDIHLRMVKTKENIYHLKTTYQPGACVCVIHKND